MCYRLDISFRCLLGFSNFLRAPRDLLWVSRPRVSRRLRRSPGARSLQAKPGPAARKDRWSFTLGARGQQTRTKQNIRKNGGGGEISKYKLYTLLLCIQSKHGAASRSTNVWHTRAKHLAESSENFRPCKNKPFRQTVCTGVWRLAETYIIYYIPRFPTLCLRIPPRFGKIEWT